MERDADTLVALRRLRWTRHNGANAHIVGPDQWAARNAIYQISDDNFMLLIMQEKLSYHPRLCVFQTFRTEAKGSSVRAERWCKEMVEAGTGRKLALSTLPSAHRRYCHEHILKQNWKRLFHVKCLLRRGRGSPESSVPRRPAGAGTAAVAAGGAEAEA